MEGAGILLNKKGYVLTNAHVVSRDFDFEVPREGRMALAPRWLAGKVLANFYGGVQCDAEVLSVDVGNDLALLKIPESVIKPYNIPCEFSKGVRDGADFFVVGHPHGPPFIVKFGFVSNRSRPLSDIPWDILNGGFPHSLEHMDLAMKFLELQVEAGPGFSGGPLSTVDGLMFGVLHAGIEGTACYGIPVAIIKSAVRRMFNRSRIPGYDVFCHLN
ncbi:hypothetical protein RHMOL_Rhmol04G0327600 [Rhododendron molle]|uniref:Uncharacterized protein n=1 Tax=Rhododendron molle TaxID=49168 RepID=A0ACC0P8D0_RHOML|nr:hypothetical protein RHMOL_Rhmol04G0327600 [Rhododendron molle]